MNGYSSITGASPLDCLMSYPGHSLEESDPSTEMQSVYSADPADWATIKGYSSLIKIQNESMDISYK